MLVKCPQCKARVEKPKGAVNCARLIGAPIYCGRECAGLARRKGKTDAQRRAEKSEYDKAYRAANQGRIASRKREYFQATYDPKAAATARKERMPKHVEYCRRPEYRAYKKAYDEARRDAEYGPFAEAARLTLNLISEVKSRSSDYEIRLANGTLNKKLQRRRQYENTVSR